MGTYKVIQDIEAEDTIIGWMTPRQAIYAAIVLVSGFIWFMFATNGIWWLGFIFLPHMILFTVLAGPFVHDQPSEVWLLAKIKFFLKPRRRIWDQSGIQELVTITVPKKVERVLTDGLSQTEVKSRLQALANTIDSRGWAIKNISTNMYAQPGYAAISSDRLIDQSVIPQEVPDYDTTLVQDVLDTANNPTAQHVQQMVTQSAAAHRQQLIARMQRPQASQPQPVQNQWFVDPAVDSTVPASQPVSQTDEQVYEKIKQQRESSRLATGNMASITPLSQQPKPAPAQPQKPHADPAVVQQYVQNNDLNIATIARQVNKPDDENEVVISLR